MILFLSSNSQLRACHYRRLGSGLFFCAHCLIFICTKFYHLLNHPVNQQFKVFLQISPHFITPNNLVPLANFVMSLYTSFADHIRTHSTSQAQALILLGVCWFSLSQENLFLFSSSNFSMKRCPLLFCSLRAFAYDGNHTGHFPILLKRFRANYETQPLLAPSLLLFATLILLMNFLILFTNFFVLFKKNLF